MPWWIVEKSAIVKGFIVSLQTQKIRFRVRLADKTFWTYEKLYDFSNKQKGKSPTDANEEQ